MNSLGVFSEASSTPSVDVSSREASPVSSFGLAATLDGRTFSPKAFYETFAASAQTR